MSTLVDLNSTATTRYTVLLFPDANLDASMGELSLMGASGLEQHDNCINKIVRFDATASDRTRLVRRKRSNGIVVAAATKVSIGWSLTAVTTI